MNEILNKLGLSGVCETFEREKITPDIVSKLSAHEMEMLDISNRTDMMRLRIESNKHGCFKPSKDASLGGAPQLNIPKTVLENLVENGFKSIDIARLLAVSERTVYRRMMRYGLSKQSFSTLTDDNLDEHVTEVIKEFPFCGENMIMQLLRQKGINIQRYRLRESIHILNPTGISERKRGQLHRRVYEVAGPNHLWHIDTNYKLVRWRFVVIGGIDGYSRMVTFMSCSDNNKAYTALESFKSGVQKYGIPKKVRSDKGLENVGVADFMLAKRGTGSMITGRSTHNQRIERLWRDVFEGVLSYFYHLFYYMEDNRILDSLNIVHLIALHYIYMEEINRRLSLWTQAWSTHRLRTVRFSPHALWISGQMQSPVGFDLDDTNDGDTDDSGDIQIASIDGRPIFAHLEQVISDNCRVMLQARIPFPRININHGIDDYITCVDIIDRHNQI
ncbi:hypothetical protein DPMN_019815 [Dreissena polymorpha]|uniref:Integrase catalytic domain-containing protein n=1 Tax=Dreissena polymorpha TaxID=45954 RepID=A0A9D4S9M5_DREPO|nr:hypothetical protein DPMN_019815 [Dreissena polymorpha]